MCRLAGRVGDEGLRCLADLTLLQSLHLGGACVVGEHACSALGGRLRALTSLQFSDCRSLGDAALYRLAPLAPGLRRLGLNNCEGVTDIALAVLLKGASRQALRRAVPCCAAQRSSSRGPRLPGCMAGGRGTRRRLGACPVFAHMLCGSFLPACGFPGVCCDGTTW